MKEIWKKYKKQWQENKWIVLKLAMFYAVILLVNETIFRKNGFEALQWMTKDFGLFVMNLATIMVVAAVLILLTKRPFLTTAVLGNVLLILGIINTGKFALRNVPLNVEDAFLIKEVLALAPEIVNSKTIFSLIALVVVIILITFALFKLLGKHKIKNHTGVFSTLLIGSVVLLAIGQQSYDGNLDIKKTGFVYYLSNYTRVHLAFDTKDLKAADEKIKSDLDNYVSFDESKKPSKSPNVIIIQSEAFWDINKMNLDTSENPIPNFEALRKESTYGEMYIPVIGGGTSNTEYEILTGMTLKNYTSDWYMVYPNELKGPLTTLASIFKTNGYESVALHPYMSWYYDRMNVYKYMGFDTFKSLEYMDKPEIIGAYTSDRYMTDEIIKTIEDTEAPLFNFTVTMQNHGPYGNHRFEEDQMTVKLNTDLSLDSNYFLKNYIQGLYYSDLELKRLVDYLRASDEPTILLFYGDHLPMLGDDYLAYRESGYIGSEESSVIQQDLKMMTVPYVLWSNYDDASIDWDVMNASFMPARLLEKIGIELPNYLKEVSALSREVPVILRTYGIDDEGNKLLPTDSEYQLALARYHLLYENIASSKYDENYMAWTDFVNGDYNLALNSINIEKAEIVNDKTIIRGSNFYETMVLYVNNSHVDFKYVNKDVILLEGPLSTSDSIRMELETDQGDIITQSNVYKYKLNN